MFEVTSFTNVKPTGPSECPPTGEWINSDVFTQQNRIQQIK